MHKYLPLAVLYFFFNNAGLPGGLTYTTLLAPLFYVWLLLQGKRWVTFKFLMCLLPFVLAHAIVGIDSAFYYARSSLFLWTAYVTVYTFYSGLLNCKTLERLFEQLIILNFWAAMVAIPLLFTPLRDVLWVDQSGTIEGAGRVLRLKMLTLEPSGYAAVMEPLLIFAVIRLLIYPGKRNFRYVALIVIPFLLCQSFGGIGMSLAGISASMLVNYRNIFRWRGTRIVMVVGAALILVLLLTNNVISVRAQNLILGDDPSTRARTDLSFILAYLIASAKSLWWGAGLGQAKLVGAPIVAAIQMGFTEARIPNAVAGTFAEFGIVGVVVRFSVEIYLFVRTRVYRNPFRLAMFVVAFILQLTGSYLMSVEEYLIWCFAFGPFFPEMDIQMRKQRKVVGV
jgi:hypothetical protein